ncbi:UROD/MetE-like protein [Laetiporus sulphureus 93-53]|uniref:UROD/MetE-like protein n=1 Tax=Laetiporus sulphureus 93-53 TaxID=1314785 RepID=A0A165IMT9_9APHY|nr:UROD/MetE-like protein [Laetiporus sulphureus 93-53]KZT13298.1 UROD/MetE-like protein [Laetiporus sulphureus 93-53]
MSAPRLRPPFRVEHTGSFKRPADLIRQHELFNQGKSTLEELRSVEDHAIEEAIQIQRAVGIKAINDGELRRYHFFEGLFDKLEGMKYFPNVPSEWFVDGVPTAVVFRGENHRAPPTYLCVSKLRRVKPCYLDEFEALKKMTTPEEHKYLKITMPSPEFYHLRYGMFAFPKSVYQNDEEYFADLIEIYRAELGDLYAAGCRNVQIDFPQISFLCNEKALTAMEKRGIDHVALTDLYLKVMGACIEGRPDDMTVGIHVCRGNWHHNVEPWSEGGYDRIAEKLFSEIPADTYYIEYDNERSGSFEPLRWLPRNKSVVLGIVTTKSTELESKEELIRRVHEAAAIIASGEEKRSMDEALNQICISPQCGFGSFSEGFSFMTEEDVAKKLKLVVETAKEIWPDM